MSKRKDAISLTSLILIIVIVVPLILAALRTFVEAGVFRNLWYDMVDLLPFGGAIAQLAIKIYTTIIPQVLDVQNYTAQIQPINGVFEFLEEFGKLCVAGVCYKAISYAGDKAMENSESKGILVFLRRVVWHLASAFLGCVASGVVLHILFVNIQAATGHGFVQGIASILMILVTLAGGAGIFWFTIGFSSVFLCIGYTLVKIFLMNACTVFVSGVFMSFIVLNLAEGTWELVIAGMAGWGFILVVLVGVDMMLSVAFGD